LPLRRRRHGRRPCGAHLLMACGGARRWHRRPRKRRGAAGAAVLLLLVGLERPRQRFLRTGHDR
jgi:hypothetical protein